MKTLILLLILGILSGCQMFGGPSVNSKKGDSLSTVIQNEDAYGRWPTVTRSGKYMKLDWENLGWPKYALFDLSEWEQWAKARKEIQDQMASDDGEEGIVVIEEPEEPKCVEMHYEYWRRSFWPGVSE